MNVKPDASVLANEDPYGSLFNTDANMCCTLRKVFPLQDALQDYDSWISGRKRFQASSRATIPVLERDADKIKINPLAMWTKEDIDHYFEPHDLPHHPLVAKGIHRLGVSHVLRPSSQVMIRGRVVGQGHQTRQNADCTLAQTADSSGRSRTVKSKLIAL